MKRTELLEKTELVSHALASDNMISVFQCLAFTGKTVYATNDALTVITDCRVDQPFAVNGQTLLGLLRNSHSDDIEFTLEQHDCLIKTGRSNFKLPYIKREDFIFEEPKNTWLRGFPITQPLLDGIQACLLTSSKDNSQPALMGVVLKHGKFYSCDGDAMTRCHVLKEAKNNTPSFMLPNQFCETLIKIAQATKTDGGTLELNEGWAKASLKSGYTIYGRLIANDNPLDHEQLIADTLKKAKPQCVPIPKGLDHALARARVVADPESAKTVLTVESGRLKLVTEAALGIVRDSLALANHPDVQANVSAELMARTAALCNEMVLLENCVVYRNGETLFVLVSNVG